MRLLLLAALMIAAPAARAQMVVDGSVERFDQGEIQEMMAVVAHNFRDPSSAQFRAIDRLDDGSFCGEVNAKNAYGGYNGFALFHHEPDAPSSEASSYAIPDDPLSIMGAPRSPCREVYGQQ